MFVGRRKELAELERVYAQRGFHLFVVGGPEGSGKTTLLEEFCRNKDAIFFTASAENSRMNLTRFSLDILAHYNDIKHEPFAFWDSAFKYIRDMQLNVYQADPNSERLVLVLDEIAEIADRDSVFMDILRKCITLEMPHSKIFLVITSSDAKFLQNNFLAGNMILSHKVSGSLTLDKFVLSDEIVEQLKEQVVRQSANMDTRKVIKYSADELIIREGEIEPDMYKILLGKAVCYFGYGTDDELPVATLKEGRTFGEYSLLTGKPETYTVVAFTDLLVMKIGPDDFTKFIEMNASNAVEIMRNMASMIGVLKANIDMLKDEAVHSLQ